MVFNWLDAPHYLETLIREIALEVINSENDKRMASDEIFIQIIKYHPDCTKEQMQAAFKNMSGVPYYSALLDRIDINS